MASNKTFQELIGKAKTVDGNASTVVRINPEDANMPVSSGRKSIAEGNMTMGGVIDKFMEIQPDFPIHTIGWIEKLVTSHPEFSQAVENITALGNTRYKIYFDDDVDDTLKHKAMMHLKMKRKLWYRHSGGLRSLVNDLLTQAAISGAISAEAIPKKDLTGIEKIVLVSPKSIRFKYDRTLQDYVPYQKPIEGFVAGLENGEVKLNEITYSYHTLRRLSEKPYALPPFLAALRNLPVDNYIVENLKHIVKKLGILGFLEVIVNAPTPRSMAQKIAGKSDEAQKQAYLAEMKSYLNSLLPEIDKGLAEGYVVGFKGAHEFNVHNTTSNVSGASELVQINDLKLMSGLKQSPFMFGRPYTTTETLGRVMLAMMISQVQNYQTLVASLFEKVDMLELQLAGYPVKNIDGEFDHPSVSDTLREAQALLTENKLLDNLYNQGVISQTTRAQESGYEKPDKEEPRVDSTATGDINPNNTGTADPAKPSAKTDPSKNSLSTPVFPYADCSCEDGFEKKLLSEPRIAQYAKATPTTLEEFVTQYYDQVFAAYKDLIVETSAAVSEYLAEANRNISAQGAVDAVLYRLYRDWETTFSAKLEPIISSFISSAYTTFRKDEAILKGMEDIPKAVFELVDYRAMDYYKSTDTFFLGKFITDPDTTKKVTQYIKDKYFAQRLPIGDNKSIVENFAKEFGDLLITEKWKIARIINTTVSSIRSDAAVHYFAQAEISEYEVVGVPDSKQCGYCKNLQGKRFSVQTTVDKLVSLYGTVPQSIGYGKPFMTSIYKKPEQMQNLTGEAMQTAGIVSPVPAHPSCRDTIVAVL